MKDCRECIDENTSKIANEAFCKHDVIIECEKVAELKLKIVHLQSELERQRTTVEKRVKTLKGLSVDRFDNESLF